LNDALNANTATLRGNETMLRFWPIQGARDKGYFGKD
jgi:hypothetical protein